MTDTSEDPGRGRAGAPLFPVWAAFRETFVFLWQEKWWLMIRALLPALVGGVNFLLAWPGVGIYAAWHIALFLLSLMFASNMLVSTHRHLLRGDRGNRFADFLPRIADLTYLGVWIALALACWILQFIGDLLATLVPMAGGVFSLGVAIVYFVLLVRLIALFPLVALQARTPFRTAWQLSEHQLGRLVVFMTAVLAVVAAVLAVVATLFILSQQWQEGFEPASQLELWLVNLSVTAPFFFGALCLMVALETVCLAVSIAYRRLEEIRSQR